MLDVQDEHEDGHINGFGNGRKIKSETITSFVLELSPCSDTSLALTVTVVASVSVKIKFPPSNSSPR